MGYILRTPTNVKYYHPCSNNGCLWKSAFDVSSDTDLNRSTTEFQKGNWLLLNSHLTLRSNTKSVVECLANICFYVYIVYMYRFVGKPPNEMPYFFNEARSLFTLTTNASKRPYSDNLCFSGVLFTRANRPICRITFDHKASSWLT